MDVNRLMCDLNVEQLVKLQKSLECVVFLNYNILLIRKTILYKN